VWSHVTPPPTKIAPEREPQQHDETTRVFVWTPTRVDEGQIYQKQRLPTLKKVLTTFAHVCTQPLARSRGLTTRRRRHHVVRR
jgi:hypothetical protein